MHHVNTIFFFFFIMTPVQSNQTTSQDSPFNRSRSVALPETPRVNSPRLCLSFADRPYEIENPDETPEDDERYVEEDFRKHKHPTPTLITSETIELSCKSYPVRVEEPYDDASSSQSATLCPKTVENKSGHQAPEPKHTVYQNSKL